MNKKVKVYGSLEYLRLANMNEEERKEFLKKDSQRIMDNHVEAHEKDEEPHYYNKDDSYKITAEYDIIGKGYNVVGLLKARMEYKYGRGVSGFKNMVCDLD